MTTSMRWRARTEPGPKARGRVGPASALVLLLSCWGCGGQAVPEPDPAVAREALNRMLVAWKDGQSPDSLESGSPSLVVADYRWRDGYRLERYEIESDDGPRGSNLKVRVKCWMRDPRGKAVSETAGYAIGTGSPLTIIRDNEL
jgi:hypothetical protein